MTKRALVGAMLFFATACSSPADPATAEAGLSCSNDSSSCFDDAGALVGTLNPDLNCPNDAPVGRDCEGGAPLYSDVAPIFAAHCLSCHGPTGYTRAIPLGSYDEIIGANTTVPGDVRDQIRDCRMPPQCTCPPSLTERHALLDWFACGAPGP